MCPEHTKLAEGVRFELTVHQRRTPVFQTGRFNHSRTPPSYTFRPPSVAMKGATKIKAGKAGLSYLGPSEILPAIALAAAGPKIPRF